MGFASLDRSEEATRSLGAVLSEDERARAARFLLPEQGARFTCARGILRKLVAAGTGVASRDVEFVYGPKGKPALAGAAAASGLRFNVSHSDGMGLFALVLGREIGADVEKVRPVRRGDRVARRFFADEEREALRNLSGPSWREAFFRCWTRKEAFIKALGEGLSRPLRSFAVSIGEEEPARLLRVDGDGGAREAFHLAAVEAPPGFVAAVAVQGPPCPVVLFDVEAETAG